MKIISPFRDYYDGVAAQMDPEPVPLYRRNQDAVIRLRHETTSVRTAEERDWPEELSALRPLWFGTPVLDGLHTQILVFCGRVVPVYTVGMAARSSMHFEATSLPVTWGCFNPEEVLVQASRVNGQPGPLARLDVSPGQQQQRLDKALAQAGWWVQGDERYGLRVNLSKKTVAAWALLPTTVPDEVHRYVGAPVFMLERGDLSTSCCEVRPNPRLAAYQLQRLIPPTEAWQQIDRIFGSVLAGQTDVPQSAGDDKIKRDAAGFDNTSFKRHASEGKKARRQARRSRA